MRLIVQNTSENRTFLEKEGFIDGNSSITSAEVKNYLYICGQRYYFIGNSELGNIKDQGADFYDDVDDISKSPIANNLKWQRNLQQDILDFLDNNVEIEFRQTPLNIGKEKIEIKVLLGKERIAYKTLIRVTNGLGQQIISGRK